MKGDGTVLYANGNDSYMNLYVESIAQKHTHIHIDIKTNEN